MASIRIRTLFFALALLNCSGLAKATDGPNGPIDGNPPAPPMDPTVPTIPDAPPSMPIPPHSPYAAMEEKIKSIFKDADVPGMGIRVLQNSQPVYHLELGVRAKGMRPAIAENDKWHLGSDTKAMTATLIAKAIEEGKFDYTTNVAKYLGIEAPGSEGVDVQSLLAHQSGLPDFQEISLNKDFWNRILTTTDLRIARVKAAAKSFSLRNPNASTAYKYANINYVALGAMLEKAYDQTWELILQKKLFTPLAMDSCGFGVAGVETEDSPSQPWAHEKKDGVWIAKAPKLKADDPALLRPAGSVHCSLADWGKFAVEIQDGFLEKSNFLTKETFTKIFSKASEQSKYTYGAWGRVEREWAKGTAFYNLGSNNFNFALIWMAPNLGTIYMITANGADGPTAKAVQDSMNLLVENFH